MDKASLGAGKLCLPLGFTDKKMKQALTGMLSEIGFEGIFSIEFLIDEDGTYYFTEINFRNSTWSYIAAKLGMPIPVLWAEAMLSGEISEGWYRPVPDHYTAMVEPIDYAKRVEEGRISRSVAREEMDGEELRKSLKEV